jgi:hypothetical protein
VDLLRHAERRRPRANPPVFGRWSALGHTRCALAPKPVPSQPPSLTRNTHASGPLDGSPRWLDHADSPKWLPERMSALAVLGPRLTDDEVRLQPCALKAATLAPEAATLCVRG